MRHFPCRKEVLLSNDFFDLRFITVVVKVNDFLVLCFLAGKLINLRFDWKVVSFIFKRCTSLIFIEGLHR